MSESEAAGASAPGVNPAAVGVALSGASRDKADLFLDNQNVLTEDQRRMLHMQMEEMREENPLKLSHLRLRRISDLGRIALQASLGILAMALVVAVGALVWSAAHSESVIVESFSVPPDMAAKGVTGQVVASQVLDKLALMQSGTVAARPAQSYAGSWGDDIKVEIPDTGVSLGEAYRFLKNWLGHDTRIGGEVVRTAAGVAITVRSSGGGAASFAGAESDLDALVLKAAEHVYRGTQAYRYGIYLNTHGRSAEALEVFKAMTASGPPQERAWGYIGWARQGIGSIDPASRLWMMQRARALNPNSNTALNNMIGLEYGLGQEEIALSDSRILLSMSAADVDASMWDAVKTLGQARVDSYLGAHRESAQAFARVIQGGHSGSYNNLPSNLAYSDIGAHDVTAARAAIATIEPQAMRSTPEVTEINKRRTEMALAAERQDWAAVLVGAEANRRLIEKTPALRAIASRQDVVILARAEARLGRFAAAEARIAATPGDCYDCLWTRARIAALHGQPGQADTWFDRAAQDSPSYPFAYQEWGMALLERGQTDRAIEKFKLSNEKGPHFADALEGWGEALMAKNESHLALAKFEEAEKYAPNWGRLHLKWGEALVYAGKKNEAGKQYARAAQLYLTPAEKAELVGMNIRG